MVEEQVPAVGAGGRLSRRPLAGPLADRIRAIHPSLVLVYEGEGSWALCQRGRRAVPAGALVAVEDCFFLIKRYPRLDEGFIEADVRRLVWRNENADILAEIDRHNERVEEARIQTCADEVAARGEYYADWRIDRRHFAVDGFGRGLGGAAR